MAVHDGPVSNGRYLQLRIGTSQNVSTNTSTVTIELWMVSTNGNVRWSDKMGVGIALNGWQAFWWQGPASYGAGTYILASSTHPVSHDANGNAFIHVAGAVSDDWVDFLTVGTIREDLPNIPRGTTPNIGGGSFTTGATTTINLPRANSGFTHDVSYKFGTKTGVIATGAGDAAPWTPDHTLLTEIPNATSGHLEITTVTRSGATVIATKKTNFSLTAGASVIPTVSAVAWDDANPIVKAAIGAFVQGLSLIKGIVTAAGVHGSTIQTKQLTIAGASMNESQVWQPGINGVITASGSATDSRSRIGNKAQNFSVLAYAAPAITALKIRRATNAGGTLGDGAFLRMDLSAAVQSLLVGTQKNALKLKVETRPLGGGAWTTRNNDAHTALSYENAVVMVTGGAAFPLNQSFDVRVTITDNCGQSATLVGLIGTGGASFDIAATGTGHGKIWERGGIDVAGDAFATDFRADQNVYAGGAILVPIGAVMEWYADTAPQGWLLLNGQAVSRTTYAVLYALWGTKYGAGNGSTTFNLVDKRDLVAVGKSTSPEFDELGKKFGTKTHTLTTAEMPKHKHSLSYYGQISGTTYQGVQGPNGALVGTDAKGVSETGGSGEHNNIQPSIAANFVVRAL